MIKFLSFFPIIASTLDTVLSIFLTLGNSLFVFLVIGNLLTTYLLIDTQPTFEKLLNNIYKYLKQ